jgi:hypothetical protein
MEVIGEHHGPTELRPVPTEEAGRAPWPVWTGVQNHMWKARDDKTNHTVLYLTFTERSS